MKAGTILVLVVLVTLGMDMAYARTLLTSKSEYAEGIPVERREGWEPSLEPGGGLGERHMPTAWIRLISFDL